MVSKVSFLVQKSLLHDVKGFFLCENDIHTEGVYF